MRWQYSLLTCLIAAVIGSVCSLGSADTITFDENVPDSRDEGDSVGTLSLGGTGITASFDNAIFAQEGSPIHAFRDDNGNLDQAESPFNTAGNWFITDELGSGTEAWGEDPGNDIQVSFSSPVRQLSFLVADLDYWEGGNERLDAKIYDADGLEIASRTLFGTRDGGDRSVISVAFDQSGISRLDILLSNADPSTDRYAVGIDNLSAVPTPTSVAALISLSVMGGLGIAGRRLRQRAG